MPTLDQRVAVLEEKVAELTAQGVNGHDHKPWLRVQGIFGGDKGMKEIFDEALKLREQDRLRAQRRYAKKTAKRRAKS